MTHINEAEELENSDLIETEPPSDEETAEEKQERAPYSDFDGAWKRILDDYLPDFIEFFFPKVYPQIDWSREYEVLDQELHKVAPSGKVHKRLTDKLIKVWRIDGSEHWVLIHIEIQSQQEIGFEQRVYVYFYRLRDLRNLPVATFVVLGDTTKEWKPNQYREELWDTKLSFEYPVVKLRDYWERWDELEKSTNPFATVVMAHLQTQKSRNKPELRYDVKLNLTRRLYRLGYDREQITDLFRFIDWVMWLPEELEPNFWQEVVEIEESVNMEYISTGERVGYRRGRAEGIELGREEGIEKGIEKGIEEGIEKGIEEGRLLGRREIFLNLFDHVYALENNDDLKTEVANRTVLIDQIIELDALLNMLLMQPPLASFMDYLPELKTEVEVQDITSAELIEVELIRAEPLQSGLTEVEAIETENHLEQDFSMDTAQPSSPNSQPNVQGIEQSQTEITPEEVQTSDECDTSDTQ